MREKIKDKGRLEHILNSIDVLLCNKGKYEYADVEKDPIGLYGFVKHVEINAQAVNTLTKEFRATHPEVDWDVIEGMRVNGHLETEAAHKPRALVQRL